MFPHSHQARLAPKWCKEAGSWSTTTQGLRGPTPRPLALFDRGSALQKEEAPVQSQDSVWWCVVGCGMHVQSYCGRLPSQSLVWEDTWHVDRVSMSEARSTYDL